jgi:hypothetical protein
MVSGASRYQPYSPWNDEKLCEALTALWTESDFSAAQIAVKLSKDFSLPIKLTRSAVIGRAQRTGLSKKNGGENNVFRMKSPRIANTSKANGFVRKLSARQPEPVVEPDFKADAPSEYNKPLLDAEPGECRWPMADVGRTPMCCGKATGNIRKPYCIGHSRVSYDRTKTQHSKDVSRNGYVSRAGRKIGALNRFV